MTSIRSSIIFYILLFLRKLIAAEQLTLKDAPCDYMDTGPVTFKNGKYMYNMNEVPENETGVYDYEIQVGNIKIKKEPHLRGCICKESYCISVCCPDSGEFSKGKCLPRMYEIQPFSYINDIGDSPTVGLLAVEFVVQFYRPCDGLYYLQPEHSKHLNYSILGNGSLYKIEENRLYDKNSYCLSPKVNGPAELVYTPLQCFAQNPDLGGIKVNAVALMISVPFMILTIVVYLTNSKLRTIHGSSLCCYLGGLIVGYSLMAYLIFYENDEFTSRKCAVLGYTTYFAFMSAFFWLSVISFDLYSNIHGSETSKRKIFRLYCLYAWGLALICLICTYIAQESNLPNSWKPGIGSKDSCFLNATHGWSAFIYFYAPILLIVIFNTIMFVLTFIQIRKGIRSSPTTHSKQHRALFMTFLRLFVIMGITWVAEILAYLTPRDSWLLNIFQITDFFNGIQGVIIFFVFVIFRKSVRRELLNKFGRIDEMANDKSYEESSQHKSLSNVLEKDLEKRSKMICDQPQEMEKFFNTDLEKNRGIKYYQTQ